MEAVGFEEVPRHKGRDEQGRDILSWIPGDVPTHLSSAYDDRALCAAARLIRGYHEASSGYVAGRGEVACHHDLSPCNSVFRDGMPFAIIDFDAAQPGSRVDDLGYAVWLWLDIGNPAVTATEQDRRLGVFVDAYGPEVVRDAVVAAMVSRQEMLVARGLETGDLSMSEWARACLAWVEQNIDALRYPAQQDRAHGPQ